MPAASTPQLVRKGQRRLDGIDKIAIELYARGMTVRDIQAQIKEMFEVDVSPDLISKITDSVLEEVRDWQARPLDRVYPVIFFNALVCKVRDAGTVKNKAAHLAVGVDADGRKQVLGIWAETTEGAKFWLRVHELKARGVNDVLIVVCDSLSPACRSPQRRLARHDRADLHRPPHTHLAALGHLQGEPP